MLLNLSIERGNTICNDLKYESIRPLLWKSFLMRTMQWYTTQRLQPAYWCCLPKYVEVYSCSEKKNSLNGLRIEQSISGVQQFVKYKDVAVRIKLGDYEDRSTLVYLHGIARYFLICQKVMLQHSKLIQHESCHIFFRNF